MKTGLAGVLVLFVLAAAGAGLAAAQIPELGDTLIEETRTPVPGSRVVSLQARKYNVFYEARGPLRSEANLPVPALEISIRPANGDGRPLTFHDYSGSFSTSGGNREATAIRTVEVPRAGRYRITTHGEAPSGFYEPRVALGEPVGRRILVLVLGAVFAVLSAIAGMILLVVVLVVKSKKKS